MKKTAKKTSTSTSKPVAQPAPSKKIEVGARTEEPAKSSMLFDFVFTCRGCGHVTRIRDYTRPERLICGGCDLPMMLKKVRV